MRELKEEERPFYHPTKAIEWKPWKWEGAKNALGIGVLLPIRVALIAFLFFLLLILTRFTHLLIFCGLSLFPSSSSSSSSSLTPSERVLAPLFRVYLRYAVRALFIVLGFRIEEHRHSLSSSSSSSSSNSSAKIIVCNHLSFLDVLYFCTTKESPAFVAKAGVEQLPVISYYAKLLDCIYLSPSSSSHSSSSSSSFSATTKAIEERLKREGDERDRERERGRMLVLFSEGTTSNGKYLLRFRNGAFVPMLSIQPCALSQCFPSQSSKSFSSLSSSEGEKNRVYWSWESVPLTYFLFRLLMTPRHHMKIQWLPVIHPPSSSSSSSFSSSSSSLDERIAQFREETRNSVAAALQVRLSTSSLPEKMAFHQAILSGQFHWQHPASLF